MVKVAIFGATGNLGPFVVDEILREEGLLDFVLISRIHQSFKATELECEWACKGIKLLRLDTESIPVLSKALNGYDTCVSLVGSGAFGWQEKLIEACKNAKVKRLVLSEFGVPNDAPQLDGLSIFEERRRIVELAEVSGVEFVTLATGGFFDFLFTPFWGWNLKEKTAKIWGSPGTRLAITSCNDVAKLVRSLCIEEKWPGRNLKVAGDVLSFTEMIRVWEELLGEKIEIVETVTIEETRKYLEDTRNDPVQNRIAQVQYCIASGAGDFLPVNNKDFNIHLSSFKENLEKLLKLEKGA